MNFNINSQYDAQKYLLNVSAFTLNNLSRHYDTVYLVDPPLPGHLEPGVAGWVVGQQPLGVGEVDLDLPAQDSVETLRQGAAANLFLLRRLITTLSSAPCHSVSPAK